MFMIPIPPTRSEIEAIPASSKVSVSLTPLTVAQQLGLGGDREVVYAVRDAVALFERRRDLGGDGGNLILVHGAEADRGDAVAAHEQLVGGGERDEHLVVRGRGPPLAA